MKSTLEVGSSAQFKLEHYKIWKRPINTYSYCALSEYLLGKIWWNIDFWTLMNITTLGRILISRHARRKIFGNIYRKRPLHFLSTLLIKRSEFLLSILLYMLWLWDIVLRVILEQSSTLGISIRVKSCFDKKRRIELDYRKSLFRSWSMVSWEVPMAPEISMSQSCVGEKIYTDKFYTRTLIPILNFKVESA